MRLTIGLSLDGLGAEHDQLRGMKGLFENLIRTFDGLAALREQHPRLRLAAAIVVSGLNHASAEKTAEWARANLPIDTLKPILVRGDPKDRAALAEAARAVYERIRDADDMKLKDEYRRGDSWHRLVVTTKEQMQRSIIGEIQSTGVSPVVCSAALENIVVRANGDVMGCEIRPEKLGNLRDYDMDVRSLWRAKAAEDFRRAKVRERCACHHHCFLAPAIMRTPATWSSLSKIAYRTWRNASPAGLQTP
jgi:radical SAM protein with 4Fe4S-binding SPASM domain